MLENVFLGDYSPAWDSLDMRIPLVTSTETPDVDTDEFWNIANANELANGNGYTTNGYVITTQTVSLIAGSNIAPALIAEDAVWTFSGGVAKAFRYAYLIDWTGNAATSRIWGIADLGAQSITDNTFTLDFHATEGVMKGTY
jgi:hypothetical protein